MCFLKKAEKNKMKIKLNNTLKKIHRFHFFLHFFIINFKIKKENPRIIANLFSFDFEGGTFQLFIHFQALYIN